jgi:hypothetical protein
MDLYRIIRDLVHERNRVQNIIESLERMLDGTRMPGKTESRPLGKRRGRKSMDEAAREEVSTRMKRYWAQRKAHSADS